VNTYRENLLKELSQSAHSAKLHMFLLRIWRRRPNESKDIFYATTCYSHERGLTNPVCTVPVCEQVDPRQLGTNSNSALGYTENMQNEFQIQISQQN
jgi:hypothetical protein